MQSEERTVDFPRLTDEEHEIIIEALAFYKNRQFAYRPGKITDLEDYIRENVNHLDMESDQF